MLSLSIDSLQILTFSSALLNKSLIFGLNISQFGSFLNAHNLCFLVSVNEKSLSICLSLIDLANCCGLNFFDDDISITLGVNYFLVGDTLGVRQHLLILCLSLFLVLGLLYDGTLDLLFKKMISTPVLILQLS